MLRPCRDCCAPASLSGDDDVDVDEWANTAAIPEVYNPPQKSLARLFGVKCSCLNPCVWTCCYCPARTPCSCCASCARCICCWGLGARTVHFSQPDDWFTQMLSYSHPNCPAELKGIWWMQDNVAAEGVLTFQDGDWETPKVMRKTAQYNWTVDRNNCGGMCLSTNFWVHGGKHLFRASSDGKWIHIKIHLGGNHWIYVLQPGDVLRRPDGTKLDITPGEDLLRVSYDASGGYMYQYLVRRIAYLDDSGALVKTQRYQEILQAALQSARCCRGRVRHHILDAQWLTPAPSVTSNAQAAAQSTVVGPPVGEAPEQASMQSPAAEAAQPPAGAAAEERAPEQECMS